MNITSQNTRFDEHARWIDVRARALDRLRHAAALEQVFSRMRRSPRSVELSSTFASR